MAKLTDKRTCPECGDYILWRNKEIESLRTELVAAKTENQELKDLMAKGFNEAAEAMLKPFKAEFAVAKEDLALQVENNKDRAEIAGHYRAENKRLKEALSQICSRCQHLECIVALESKEDNKGETK